MLATTSHLNTTLLKTFKGHKGPIYAICQGNEENTLYSSGNDNSIIEWNLNNTAQAHLICKLPAKAFSFAYITQKHLLIAATFKGFIHLIDLQQKTEIKCIHLQLGIIYQLYINESNSEIYALTEQGVLCIFDIETFVCKNQIKISAQKIRSICKSPQTNEWYIGSGDGKIYVLDFNSFQIKQVLVGHYPDHGVNCLALVNDYLISGSRDGHLLVWDPKNNHDLLKKIPAHNYAIYQIVSSPNALWIATCSMDKTIKIWDAHTLEILKRIDYKSTMGHTGSVNALYWNTHGLWSASDDAQIKLWSVTN